jgi:hypothetical protein
MFLCFNPLTWARALHALLITNPLHQLYFHGPSTLGFWNSAPPEDICSTLTGTPSYFWSTHVEQCAELREQKFRSFSVGVNFIVYSYILLRCLNGFMFHLSFTRPVLQELRIARGAQPRITKTVE